MKYDRQKIGEIMYLSDKKPKISPLKLSLLHRSINTWKPV